MEDGTLLVTNDGLRAVIAANKSGTEKVTITSVGLGSGKYKPAANRTALLAPFAATISVSDGPRTSAAARNAMIMAYLRISVARLSWSLKALAQGLRL